MTCIVGVVDKGKVFIGGDSAGVDSNFSLVQRRDRKVFVNGHYAFGFTSSFRMGQLLAYSLSPPNPPDDNASLYGFMVTEFIDSIRHCLLSGGVAEKKDEVETGGSFLVAVAGRLFNISDDYQVGESIHSFDACGCGEDIALGSLYSTREVKDPRKRIVAALNAAETFSAGVRAPFHIVCLS